MSYNLKKISAYLYIENFIVWSEIKEKDTLERYVNRIC